MTNKCFRHLIRNLILYFENIDCGPIECLRPKLCTVPRIHELSDDTHRVAGSLQTAVQYRTDIELFADETRVDVLVFLRKRGCTRDYRHIVNLPATRHQSIRKTVHQVALTLVPAGVLER